MAVKIGDITRQKVNESQCKDAGMAFVLILLILNLTFQGEYWLILAIALLVITMSAPGILKPLAVVWYGAAEFIGTYVSKMILYIVFYAVVMPVGVLRRMLKKDTLKLKQFKKGQQSVMDDRNITYKPEDIIKPF